MRSKDGLVSVYGTPFTLPDDPAAIANPENRAEVFSWQLTKTVDPFGNTIQYEYERDSGDTADHHWDQLYLKRIQYADYTELGTDGNPVDKFLVSVTFVYEERPDPFSDHRAGFEIRTRRRCTSIEIRTHADRERLVRTYRLIYLDQRGLPIEQPPLNAVSLLSQVLVEGHDGERRESLPPLEFGYTAFEPSQRRYQPFTGAGGFEAGALTRPSRIRVGRSDRQRFAHRVEFNEQVRYWRNLGNGQFDLMRTMETAPAGVRLSAPGVQLLDANGNGRADLMVIEGLRNGYYPLTFDGQWNERGFVRYRSAPTINLDAPDVRLAGMLGTGTGGILWTYDFGAFPDSTYKFLDLTGGVKPYVLDRNVIIYMDQALNYEAALER